MKILLEGSICVSPTCKFKKECANHETAGDFRTESGFTPKLHKEGNSFFCDTYDRDMDENGMPDGVVMRDGFLNITTDKEVKDQAKNLEFNRKFPPNTVMGWATFDGNVVQLNGEFDKQRLLKLVELLND